MTDKIVCVWQYQSENDDERAVSNLAKALGVTRVTAGALMHRGISDADAARDFLNPKLSQMPDPALMAGMEEALDRLAYAVKTRERVTVYGDYDVDGITGTALLLSFFRRLGIECQSYIPNRADEGYGLHKEALSELAEGGAKLVVCVDTGSSALEEAAHAKALGLDLVIVDHHKLRDSLPDAVATINPQRGDCRYPFKELAAVGVAFNLLVALRSRLAKDGFINKNDIDLREWLDLVALGSVADIVPLLGPNRIFTAHGLKLLTTSKRPGVIALKEAARVKGTVDSYAVGFQLGPRLNAGGRMDSAKIGVDLFLEKDLSKVRAMAARLEVLNTDRQNVENAILNEVFAKLDASPAMKELPVIVLASRDWHPGVVGIVASRVVDRLHKPVFLIAVDGQGVGKASGRSVAGIDIHKALTRANSRLMRYGGHEMAAGLSIMEKDVDSFRDDFAAAVTEQTGGAPSVKFMRLDAIVQPAQLADSLLAELSGLAPHGAGNPQPSFGAKNLMVERVDIVNDSHYKLQLAQDGRRYKAMGWRMAHRRSVNAGMKIDIAYVPKLDSFQGTTELTLSLLDFMAK